jgi:hypothetical protein
MIAVPAGMRVLLVFIANPFSAVRAFFRRCPGDEFDGGLANCGQCRLRQRTIDSFFPALPF